MKIRQQVVHMGVSEIRGMVLIIRESYLLGGDYIRVPFFVVHPRHIHVS